MLSPFVADKQAFFQSVNPETSIDDVSTRAKKDFSFLTAHRGSTDQELSDLQAVLNNNGKNRRASWLYCYYTASMLKNYHNAYSPACANAIKYSELCDALEKRINNKKVRVPDKETLFETIASDLYELSNVPFSMDKLRNWTGKVNMQRLSTRFSMITAQQSLLLAKQYHYLDGLERMMGRQVNIAVLNAPVGVYNALSVGVFGFRTIINLTQTIQHTFFPAPGETISMGERFYEEVKNRHVQMTNDIVWGIVNGLSNYAAYFHIAAPVANYLLIGFTVFDALWLSYVLYMTDQNYALKRQEYIEYRDTLEPGSDAYLLENEKLDQLALAHEKARSEIVFYIAAACILPSSLAVMFLLAPAALVPVCFLICNLAIAMYLSGSQYAEYKEKCLIVKQQQDKGLNVSTDSMKNVQKAWDNLGFTVAKNTVAPLIILGAFTISFPLAILLTLAYLAYECGYLTRLPELTAPAMGR